MRDSVIKPAELTKAYSELLACVQYTLDFNKIVKNCVEYPVMSNDEKDHSVDNGIVLGVLSSSSLNTEDGMKTNQLPSAETSARQKKWHQIFRVDVIVVTITIAIMIG